MSEIMNGKVVGMTYLLKNSAGVELDRAEVNDPFVYLHGNGNIVPGLESALHGLKVGDRKSVSVEPQDGYGEVVSELKMKVERASFPDGVEITAGMQFSANINEHSVPFTVMSVEGNIVTVDGNHPLAGEKLFFDIEVLSIRAATDEEMAHGHAHGPGGHQH